MRRGTDMSKLTILMPTVAVLLIMAAPGYTADPVQEGPKITIGNAGPGDQFGSAVAVSRNTAIIGAPRATRVGPESGAAYVLVRTCNKWGRQATLQSIIPQADQTREWDWFGLAVAIDN